MKNQLSIFVCAFLVLTTASNAHIADKKATKESSGEEVQRTPRGEFDLQRNVVSNLDFYTTNYGIFGYNVSSQVGGTMWPRGKRNQYIFAGGAWLAALKRPPGSTELRKRVMITYNPNSAQSWMVPGTIEDGSALDRSPEAVQKFRTYFSPDFSSADGTDFSNPTYPAWPIWDSSPSDTLRINNYYGYYVNDIDQRNRANFSKGPAYISNEDVYCVFKDTDLSRYEGGAQRREAEGFPLGFQVEQMIYSWGFGDYADMIFLKYMFIHPTTINNDPTDTLYQCWMAAVMDVDIALATNSQLGAANDRARYYTEEDSLNLAVQWTNGDRGETNQGFGYLGFNFLESPAVDVDGFLRKDKKQFSVSEQLGLRTFRNWPITVDPIENEDRYNFMSSGQQDGDDGPGDRRMLMATGPFNVRPGDSARIVVGVILGSTATGKDATGTTEDMTELIRKVRFAQFVYDNEFRAPEAPNLSVIKGYQSEGSFFQVPEQGWLGLNNAVVIKWDSTAELSIDTLERGMDFLGYRIYRARRTDLDTFDVDYIPNQRKGPLAWKQIGRFQISPPFLKSATSVPVAAVAIDEFEIADVVKAGQKKWLVIRSPLNVQPWFNYWSQLLDARANNPNYGLTIRQSDSTLNVSGFDTYDSVRFTYYSTQFDELPLVHRVSSGGTGWGLNANEAQAAKDSLMNLILAKKVKMEPFTFRDTVHTLMGDGSTRIDNVRRPFEETSLVRHRIMAPFFKQQTRSRTFFDYGDDDGSGEVSYDANPEKSEKLINNVDYYYTVRGYDEGDFFIHMPSKLNIRAVGLPNTVLTMPLASRPGKPVEFEFVLNENDRPRLGGIYNLRLLVDDEQRFNQLFAGKTLELEFFRDWFGYDHDQVPANDPIGIYTTLMILRDSASGEEIQRFSSALPPQLCGGGSNLAGFFTENSITYVDTAGRGITSDTMPLIDTVYNPDNGSIERIDTTTFHFPDNTERVLRSGNYTTAAPCFSDKYALGAVGVAFDYSIEQWGGVYRSGSTGDIVSGGDANIYIGAARLPALVYNTNRALNQPPAYFEPPYPGWTSPFIWPTSYNNGPGVYEITFTSGSTETITTQFRMSANVGDEAGKNPNVTFENIPYLNMTVRNVAEFNRTQVNSDGSTQSVAVNYPFDLRVIEPELDSAPQLRDFPNPELIPMERFAIAAYGWRNTQNGDSKPGNVALYAADSNNAYPLGQGKYYRSRNISTTGKDTLDFCHVMSIAGAQFTIDFSRKGRRNNAYSAVPAGITAPSVMPQTDFQAGDKIRVYTFGGALGFPFDSVKAYARIKQYDPEIAKESFTDQQLEQVQVVPNPYYVTHEGIRSPFEGRLYFTRLPRKATISIYTTNGDLIQSFQHDEQTSDDPTTFATHVWDLLTKNRQRVASQMLVAKIETPDGASVTRKFSIVVGPARIATEE